MITIPHIADLVPHRGPMLLVDKVTELVAGERVVAQKAVSFGEPWYRPVAASPQGADLSCPLGIVLESFNQACAVLVMATWSDDGSDVLAAGVPMLGSYTDIALFRTVQPGDTMEHRATVLREADEAMALHGETFVDGECVLTATRGLVIRRPAPAMTARRDIATT